MMTHEHNFVRSIKIISFVAGFREIKRERERWGVGSTGNKEKTKILDGMCDRGEGIGREATT